MDVVTASAGYERWLAGFGELHEPDLAYKHWRMADSLDPFPFFRGTYYLWADRWPEVAPELLDAPSVLAVGDLHVENFGTWRDLEGRLCWGVNDFDEADDLPYTHDIVRLAVSARFARKAGALAVKFGRRVPGHPRRLPRPDRAGGEPFVLEERHPELRTVATADERDPAVFWRKLTKLLKDDPAGPPADARAALARAWPADDAATEYRFRGRAGMGSLGRRRYVALADWDGGWVCREAKATAPPATAWLARTERPETRMAEAVGRSIRCADPFYRPEGGWVTRRLARAARGSSWPTSGQPTTPCVCCGPWGPRRRTCISGLPAR